MTTEQIEKTFKHINSEWDGDDYESCHDEWDDIEKYIIKNPDLNKDIKCDTCDTFWSDKKYIFLRKYLLCL